METKEEKIEKALDMTIRNFLNEYKTVKQFSEEIGYEGSSWVLIKAKKFKLGILGGDLGFHGAGVSTRYLSMSEQDFLKEMLANPQPAGRKKKEVKEEDAK